MLYPAFLEDILASFHSHMPILPPDSVLQHVVDVHCHPTDAPTISAESMDGLNITICAMATRQADQLLVRQLADAHPTKVVPCFG